MRSFYPSRECVWLVGEQTELKVDNKLDEGVAHFYLRTRWALNDAVQTAMRTPKYLDTNVPIRCVGVMWNFYNIVQLKY